MKWLLLLPGACSIILAIKVLEMYQWKRILIHTEVLPQAL